MNFDLTTFGLEILNFLVLVWLLKHFFYQPVLAVIEKRQAATAQTIMDAKNIQQEAEDLKTQYESRLADRDKEDAIAKAKLNEEISAQRVRRLESLDAEMATQRKRRESIEERERTELQRILERKAIQLASHFATRLLERFADSELNAKLADLAISELASLPDEKKETLHDVLKDRQLTVKIISAYILNELQRTALSNAVSKIADREVLPEFSQDPLLKAGVSITVGSWVLMANLRDELSFFSGNSEHDS